MLYLMIGGVLLLILAPYIAIKGRAFKDDKESYAKQKKAAGIIALIGIIGVSIGVIGLVVDNGESKKNTPLALNKFKSLYIQNAKDIGAKYDFDWTLSEGEKANTIQLTINDSVSWSVSTKKDENKTIIGSILIVETSEDKKLEEALLSLYAMIKTYEPALAESTIRTFTSSFINQTDSDTYKSGIVEYTKKSIGNNFMLFIKYVNLDNNI